MFEDKQMPITLDIAGTPMDLRVLAFTGQEALNEPYRFDIDLISTNPHVDMNSLAGKPAWLSFGVQDAGVHGLIHDGRQLHAGTCVSLYRITLAPSLMKLELGRQRRVFKDQSVPRTITLLLEQQGFNERDFRFERPVGIYPPRDLCVQYDETDLHLLQRLCEEEGIHFRFEHHRDGHVLVFADDPASFPERQGPVRFRLDDAEKDQPAIGHLSERLTLHPASEPLPRHEWLTTDASPPGDSQSRDRAASNQPFDTRYSVPTPHDEETHHRQISARTLERLRCERRHVHGRSRHCPLTSGQIMQVLDHPVALFNDQWLLVNVHHRGKQPQVLEGLDPHDIAAVLTTENDSPSSVQALGRLPVIESFEHGYRNGFGVLPWAMTFRPSCTHHKPGIGGDHHVTLMGEARSTQTGEPVRLAIRYDWQQASTSEDEKNGWPLAALSDFADLPINALIPGDKLVVRHFDNDPDRPVICGVPDQETAATLVDSPALSLRLNGNRVGPELIDVQLEGADALCVHSRQDLTIDTANTTLLIGSAGITLTGPSTFNLGLRTSTSGAVTEPAIPKALEGDLRLTEHPGLSGAPLAHRIWYIVAMAKPGLDQLARLDPKHLLFEGKTDELGYLGLTPAQRRELAARYRASPEALCLVHPGCCIRLHDYFSRNWSEQRLREFLRPDG